MINGIVLEILLKHFKGKITPLPGTLVPQGVEQFVEIWYSDSTQATLKALVERLKGK